MAHWTIWTIWTYWTSWKNQRFCEVQNVQNVQYVQIVHFFLKLDGGFRCPPLVDFFLNFIYYFILNTLNGGLEISMEKKIIDLKRQIKSVLSRSLAPLNVTNVAMRLGIDKKTVASLLIEMRQGGKIHAYPAGYYSTRRREIPLDKDRNAVIMAGDSIAIKNTDIIITLHKVKEAWIYDEDGYTYSCQVEIISSDIRHKINVSCHERAAHTPQEFDDLLPGYRFIFSHLTEDSIQVEVKRQ